MQVCTLRAQQDCMIVSHDKLYNRIMLQQYFSFRGGVDL